MDFRCGAQDRQFALRFFAVGEVRGNQRPWRGEFAREQRHAGRFVQLEVGGFDADRGQQFGHHHLVHVGILAQVDRGEVEAEHAQRALQRLEPRRGERRGAVAGERVGDHLQVGGERRFVGIGLSRAMRFARRDKAGARVGGRGQPGIDAGERLAVGLVLAVLGGVARRMREPQQRRRRLHQALRHGEFRAHRVHLFQVVRESGARLPFHRFAQHLGGDERIAVAVAADPGTHPQQHRQGAPAKLRFHFLVQTRYLDQERQAVERQRILDFIDDAQPGEPDHRRLPEGQDARLQPRFDARAHGGAQARVFELRQGGGDAAFAVEDALALDFGRMRGEHRHDQRAREPGVQLGLARAAGAHARQRIGETARLGRRALAFALQHQPVGLAVFGDVQQMQEVAEGAHHVQGLVAAEGIELRFQPGARRPGFAALGATKSDRLLADVLDALVAVNADLVAQYLAQHAPEVPRLLPQMGACVHASYFNAVRSCVKTLGVAAAISPFSSHPVSPLRSPTRPPASCTISAPAAMSQGDRPISQNASRRPAAT